MRIYTVTGLLDDESGELYVSGVFPGRHDTAETAKTTHLEGYGALTRFLGFFEADTADEAEQIAVDVVSHYADSDASQWAPKHTRATRATEDVNTELL
jgi:hypothetical protein